MRYFMVFFGLLITTPAWGQNYSPQQRFNPPLSPYMNLLRGGSPAVNFYLGVVPDQMRQNQKYQMDAKNLLPPAPEEQADLLPVLPQTGHLAGFQYFGYYYNYTLPPRSYFPVPPTPARK